ncbi:putative RecT protein [Mesorhizobium plurifarium]|uniref:Putative RecT protein n=1 Tax=Mesorhizobium plurifarium TaxID=69974 RepID=A0A090EAE4_MESPL|nr:putative RecT protein [Mesorhizobium plurifarium]
MANELTTTSPGATDLVDVELFSQANVFDTERFEQIMRVADVMARATTIPEALKSKNSNPQEKFEETRGNCFMVCNLSATWGADPFAVAQSISFVFGKLCVEGKLIRAVIKKKLGFDLHYRFDGAPGNMERKVLVSDLPFVDEKGQPVPDDAPGAVLSPKARSVEGTLKKWHSKNKEGGVNDNWLKDEEKMFRERGAREWCRAWTPGLLLGVYSPDEFDEVEYTMRSNRARDITINPLVDDGGRQSQEPASKSSDQHQEQRSSGASQSQAPRTEVPDEKAGSQESHPQRLPAEIFGKYASALGRMATANNVRKAHESFWSDYGKPAEGTADHALAGKILNLHNLRVEGKAEGNIVDEIDGLIAESFGEKA